MKDAILMRMIDANANRAREALRVMEDFCRFGMNDAALAGELKEIRHGLAGVMAGFGDAVLFRDTAGDVGTSIKTQREGQREGLGDVVVAAGKRLSEALRVIEECLKVAGGDGAGTVEKLRYRGYVVEQLLSRFALGAGGRETFGKVRLYVLLTESVCSSGWEETLNAVLDAAPEGGKLCVQLREKGLDDGELLRRARIVVEKCRRVGAVSIVNDRVDIALMAGADGVHVGQGDLPCAEVRKVAGTGLIVGVSTGRIEEARQAVREGASYVAVGPMFETKTKAKPRIAGPAYAREVVGEIGDVVPVVAIGGINSRNVGEVVAAGVRCVSVCAAVIGATDPAAAVRDLMERIDV